MINKRSIALYIGFLLIALLGILHFSAIFFYLYWMYWWFDGIMHFLAGLAGGFATFGVLRESGLWGEPGARRVAAYIWATFICVMVVGIAWEIFENVNGITDSHEGYGLDVAIDLILDGAGALVAGLIGTKISSIKANG